ncbi:hypothetical protein EUX98_g2883 [Antrodiella citrinella]|uniref:SET domain-containing protein n=1 Tax=Antrodiella citrinella TaxID=2447956 RepID=A0A4S4N038_9APHY|nr:hypothetical protein EUX98_g2883 [Antrodiella citrinella]
MSSRASTIFTVAGVTVLGGLVAYAVYFDYRRRNDNEFRRKLRKDKKKVKAAQSDAVQASAVKPEDIRAALLKVREEELPENQEEKEAYFLKSVDLGERLCHQGPTFHLDSALSFYRALRVYPSPVELVMIYQKTVPEPVFKIVMDMMQLDCDVSTWAEKFVRRATLGYYDVFPAKHFNVSVQDGSADTRGVKRKILVVAKDFEAGDVIYKEEPLVAVLDPDLQGKGTHCSYCLRHIQKGMAIKPEVDRLDSVYCSKDCQLKAKVQSQSLLFSLDPYLPPEMDSGIVGEQNNEKREQAQQKFAEFIKNKSTPLLVARFVGRQVATETSKLVPGQSVLADFPQVADKGSDYGIYDHIERLRFWEPSIEDSEVDLLRDVLASALPGLETSVTTEQYVLWKSKMTYNAFGVCYGGGRDDKPVSTDRPEDQERTRTPYGTSRQVGSGFYAVSSYLQHSCAPTARTSFSNGTSELHLIAFAPLKKGDEITVSYVDITQHASETPEEARRRRRMELVRGWKFKCECTRCLEELQTSEVAAELELGVDRDESKVERTAERLARGEAFPAAPVSAESVTALD